MLSQPAPISVLAKTFYQQTSRTCPIIVLVATGEERGFSRAAEAPNAAALAAAPLWCWHPSNPAEHSWDS